MRAIVAAVPALGLALWSTAVFVRARTFGSLMQLIGAGCVAVVVLTHICEAFRLLSWMHWGEPQSVGHYVDLSSALVGVTLLPAGYWLHRRRRERASS